ncbi:MAG: ferredoxin [Solirubrobacteraceae bacterium]|jgi:ferredoxin-like protein FixX|nr:ferredoxin [Solirubrobacteraceae bacterium]
MRTDGIFIGIEVDDAAIAAQPELPAHLAQVCPVDIYREAPGGGLEIVDANVDECVLCGLCLAQSDGAVRVLKLYDGDTVLGV